MADIIPAWFNSLQAYCNAFEVDHIELETQVREYKYRLFDNGCKNASDEHGSTCATYDIHIAITVSWDEWRVNEFEPETQKGRDLIAFLEELWSSHQDIRLISLDIGDSDIQGNAFYRKRS